MEFNSICHVYQYEKMQKLVRNGEVGKSENCASRIPHAKLLLPEMMIQTSYESYGKNVHAFS